MFSWKDCDHVNKREIEGTKGSIEVTQSFSP